MLPRGSSAAGHGDRRAWGCSPAALGPWHRVEGNGRVGVRRPPAPLPCFLAKLPPQREQHETHTTAVHSNLSPIPARLASSRHLRELPGSRRREMAARAPLAWSHTAICWPNVGTAAPATGLNFGRSLGRLGVSLPKAREGRVPGGSAWSPESTLAKE